MNAAFNAGAIVGDTLYYSEIKFNSLSCIDLTSGKVYTICEFPGEESWQDYLHRKALLYNEKIIFLPQGAHFLHIYDLNTHMCEKISIRRTRDQYVLFCDGFVENGLLWLFPAILEQPILIIEIESGRTVEEWSILQETAIRRVDEIFTHLVKSGQYVFLATFQDNKIIKLDISKKNMEIFSFEKEKFYSIFTAGNEFWISACSQKYLYVWNYETNTLKKQEIDASNEDRGSYIVIDHGENGIFFIPTFGRKRYCLKNGWQESFLEDRALDYYTEQFLNYNVWRGKIILFPSNGASIEVISNHENVEKLKLDFSDCAEYMEKKELEGIKHKIKNSYIEEDQCYNLVSYIGAIIS